MIPAESLVFNEDCMAVMARYPDKYFDLAVVDPPYGGGGGGYLTEENGSEAASTPTSRIARTGGKWAAKYGKKL